MVISIKEPGVDGGGGFWLFWSAVSSCFFFLPNSPPIPLAIAPLRLESLEFDEEDAEEEEAEELEFCAVPPDASCCPAMDIVMYWSSGKPFRLAEFFCTS